jgi:hypothetical protein
MLVAIFVFPAILVRTYGATPSAPTVFVTSKDYAGSIVNDTTLLPGSTFAIQVNVTNAPSAWNGFEFALYYDQRYINVTSYDDTTLFTAPHAAPGNYNGPGALRLSIVDFGVATQSNGTLANIIFTVIANGVSPLTLAAGMAQTGNDAGPSQRTCPACPSQAPNWTHLLAGTNYVGVNTKDGYFTNQGSLGPVSSFTYSWNNATGSKYPARGQPITFNATSSYDPDNRNALNHGISEYQWDFGIISNGNQTTFSPTITHVFSFTGANTSVVSGNFSIRLTVIDFDNDFQGMSVQLLSISATPSHCIAVSAIFLKSQVNPGTTEQVQVQLTNSGTYDENFNLTVGYGPQGGTLPAVTNSSLAQRKVQSYSFNITTNNLVPTLYLITARVTLYGNRTTPIIPNCAQGTFTTPFQVVVNGSGGAALVILEAVIVLVAVIAVISVLMRRRRRPEPP